jgi:hypothetical protein
MTTDNLLFLRWLQFLCKEKFDTISASKMRNNGLVLAKMTTEGVEVTAWGKDSETIRNDVVKMLDEARIRLNS